ncbi:putative transcriptional regulator [Magnetospirillum sp. XM-1]|uniref:hypothetical protein n=1 Tax=Magnetospirillum sp. XM-1 TaxID=1663591 RepID=UPI00073E0360|nr:hypothetical protein [Magnetospirillum sp. XM-1]CUW41104.1 putative transcriptional regulator [Magnetospirillum sp. XM-1]
MTTDRATAIARARAAWGESIPAWVLALAEECDRTSAKRAATLVQYSPATVSYVLSNTYRGDLAKVEQVVRGRLMAATVACPLVGDLATDLCMRHQSAEWSPHNPQRIAFYRACRAGCPHSRIDTGGQSHG